MEKGLWLPLSQFLIWSIVAHKFASWITLTLINEALVSISDNNQRLKSPRNYRVCSPEAKGIKLQALNYTEKNTNKAMKAQITQNDRWKFIPNDKSPEFKCIKSTNQKT